MSRPLASWTRRWGAAMCAALLAASVLGLVPGETAGAAAKLGAPGSITASWNATTPTTLDVSWTSPGGAYLEYQLMYRVDADAVWDPSPSYPAAGWLTPSGAATVRTTSASIQDLATVDSYVVAVRARDRQTGIYGAWGLSGLIVPAGTPGRPSGIGETARTASSLSLSWAKATGASGGYDVRVSEDVSPRAWATTLGVAQPGSGSTVSAAVGTANLPSGHSTSKTYVAQVRSRSASGTCGTPAAKCSRWVESGPLAQLDITGLSAAKKLAGTDPSHMRESDRAWDLEVTWDEVSAASSYRAQFYWRLGKPSDYYDDTDTNTVLDAEPDDWNQDWKWYYDCNDADASTNPPGSRGCNDPWTGTAPYLKPVWSFGTATWDAEVTVPTTACSSGTCTWTFADSTIAWLTDSVRVWAVVGSGDDATAGPVSQYRSTAMSPPGTPFDLAISAPTGASVKLTWTRPYHRSSPITGYDLTLVEMPSRTVVRSVIGTTGTPAPDETSPNRLSYTFHGVPTSKDYLVEIAAVSAAGKGKIATSQLVTLAATKPPQPLLSVVPGEKGSGKLTLVGKLSDSGGAAISRWEYRTKTGDTYGSWQQIANSASSSLEHVISGLIDGTSYTYRVRACNSTECSIASSDGTSMPVALPSQPTGFIAGSNRNGYVFVAAKSPATDPPLVRWEYWYKRASDPDPSTLVWHPFPVTSRTLDRRITGLTNGTAYTFMVRAVTAAGPGPSTGRLNAMPNQGTKPKVSLALSPASVSEGGTVTVTASFPWGTSSTADTVLTVSVANGLLADASDWTLSANRTLIIPAYTQFSKGTVTVATTSDFVAEPDETLTVSATVSNTSSQGVTAPDSTTLTISNDDMAGLVYSTTSVAVTEGGASGAYTVTLGSQPTSPVSVGLTSTNSLSTTVSPASLSFSASNWNVPQTVTVTAANDSDGTGGSFNISHAVTSTDATYSSLAASTVSVSVADDDIPSAPAAPTWDPGATSVTLSWSAPTYLGGTGATVAGYEVRYQRQNAGSGWTTVTPSSATSTTVTVSNLIAASVYNVQVRVKNNSNFWSAWSATTTATPGAADAPASLTVAPGNRTLTLTWSAPVSLNGGTLIGYLVQWTCGPASNEQLVQNTTTYTIVDLGNGVACDVAVSALTYVGSDGVLGAPATTTATPTGS